MPRLPTQGRQPRRWRWQPRRGTEVIVVPLDEPSRPVRFPTDAFFQWHFANAHSPSAREVVVGQRRQVDGTGELIELLLGVPVYLDIRVKVAKDWQKDPKQLRRLGF